jgi:hypothetical protein
LENELNSRIDLPPGLSAVAGNRDAITTSEYAKVLSSAEITIYKHYGLNGNVYGVTPIKAGKKLLWPVDQIARFLRGEQ